MEGHHLTHDQRYELIQAVKHRPALWNKSEETSYGVVKREQLWDEVAAAISLPSKKVPSRVAKEAFRHMRDAFKKIMRKLHCDPVEAQNSGQVTWRFFGDLMFLWEGHHGQIDEDFSHLADLSDELKSPACIKEEPDSSSRKRAYRFISSTGEIIESSPGPSDTVPLTMPSPLPSYDDGFARYGDLITDVARRLDAKMLKHDLLDFKKAVTDLVHEYEKRML
ncbi:hypothetical protein L596_030349 [Steinernema carpocapsae]|uniref:MADF domain-containing protein n=1 Tax=Steinernema carpocapsae TaxID=34508 RepID=A0A4U5LP56_STECR|nr:hypothetical protein L596_030349 [Steinernema carpocapsae]